VTPALRTAGNIVTGDDVQTQVMINAGCLEGFVHLIRRGKRGLRKEACWAISNILAGSYEQIQVRGGTREGGGGVVRYLRVSVSSTHAYPSACCIVGQQMVIELGGLGALVEAIMLSEAAEVRREACWALSNATSGCNAVQVVNMVASHVVPALGSESMEVLGRLPRPRRITCAQHPVIPPFPRRRDDGR